MDAAKSTENPAFWLALDTLVAQSDFVIESPQGSAHARYPSCIYPYDYGYLLDTMSSDGLEIDVWRGSDALSSPVGIIVTVDLVKRDSEIKLLIGCTDDETEIILQFHNNSEYQKGILIRRPSDETKN